MEILQKDVLPPGELGDDCCFQVGYFGHGDIIVSIWPGSISHEPRYDDDISSRFGFAHGSEAPILASMIGYLNRLEIDQEKIRNVFLTAGKSLLDELDGREVQYSLRARFLAHTANGEVFKRFDINDEGLECLVVPIPSQPGVIDNTGGTGIYTRDVESANKRLVFASHVPIRQSDGTRKAELGQSAEFCETDIPVMARLVCDLALGEYKKELQGFLTDYLLE